MRSPSRSGSRDDSKRDAVAEPLEVGAPDAPSHEHLADIHLPKGFIWTKGQCGQGSFRAAADGPSVAAEKSSWMYDDVDWSNG